MVRKIVGWVALALGLMAVLTIFVTPWPSVMVIRSVFDAGAATASEKLARHVPAGVTAQTGLSYDDRDPDARFDIYRPANVDPATPTIVWIHGGGFVSGRRQDITNYLKILSARGFVVVNLDYTIAPEATYPTPVRQVNRALAYLSANADRLRINADRLVLAGDSAGAQIAAQTATVITNPAYAQSVGIAGGVQPGQLAGTLLHCGVYNVGGMGRGGGVIGWFVQSAGWAYSGNRQWRDAGSLSSMSLKPHLTAAFPATFISAGNADPLAPQSVAMAGALRNQGIAVTQVFYPADHGPQLGHEYQFDLDTADGRRVLDQSVDWLKSL